MTPRISIQADGSASKPRTVSATAMLATGRRITRAIVRCQPVPPVRLRNGRRARRFQRSRWRWRRTSTTGSRSSPVRTDTAATTAIAIATERITITGKSARTDIVSASVIPE